MRNHTGLSKRGLVNSRTGKQLRQARAAVHGALGKGSRGGPADPAQAYGLRSRRRAGKQWVTALLAIAD